MAERRSSLTAFSVSCLLVSFRSCGEGSEIGVQCHDRGEPRSDQRQKASPQNIQVHTCSSILEKMSAKYMLIQILHFSHRQCCSGKELVDWLMKQNECLQSRSQAVGMWQVLVDEAILVHGKN